MPHDPAKLRHDILRASYAIRDFVADRTLDDYSSDLMLRSATERQFEIVGAMATIRMIREEPT